MARVPLCIAVFSDSGRLSIYPENKDTVYKDAYLLTSLKNLLVRQRG